LDMALYENARLKENLEAKVFQSKNEMEESWR
jgi:hypothetical protein